MHRLAHFSIDRLRASLADMSPLGFLENFALLIAAMEGADGFVWRPDEMPDQHPKAVAQLAVWKSPESLECFVRRPVYRSFQLRSDEWFDRRKTEQEVVWWVSSLRHPTVADGFERLLCLRESGPSLRAFRMGDRIPLN